MKITSAFPSTYLKAEDIPDGKFVAVVIEKVTQEDVGGQKKPEDRKPVLHFAGKDKGMVLNKTNAKIIAKQYGEETDEWTGQKILLYQTEVEFKGDMVAALRVKIPKEPTTAGNGAVAAKPTITRTADRQPEQPFGDEEEFKDDDISF